MQNVTVTIDDETYRLWSAKAASAGVSVDELIRACVADAAKREAAELRFERLQALQEEALAAIHARGGDFRAADNIPREALHERDAVR